MAINTRIANRITMKNIILFFFALRGVIEVWLAFASELSAIITIISYGTVPLGCWYVMRKNHGKTSKANFSLLVLPFLYWLMLIMNTYGGYSFDWITTLIATSCFLLMADDDKADTFSMFYWTVQICNIVSLLVYFCYILNIDIGFRKILYYAKESAQMGYYYQKCGIIALVQTSVWTRLCGIFNEPGALGTVCALLYIVTNQYIRKWEKAVLLLTIFCTFSMAGYLLVFLYYVIHFIKKDWRYAILAVMLIGFFFVIPEIDWGNDNLNYLARRMRLTETGLVGDNRTTDIFDIRYAEFLRSPDAFFGRGAGFVLADLTSSYKTIIVEFGIVGAGLLLLCWIYFAVKKSRGNWNNIIALLLFFVSLYQRTQSVKSMYGYIMVFGGIAWINYKETIFCKSSEKNSKVLK